MLRKLRVDNFKSLINVELRPGRINLLVGSNNSGKTNLCQALTFLSSTAQVPLDQAAAVVSDPWLFTNVYLSKSQVTFELECDLELGDEALSYTYRLVLVLRAAMHLGPLGRELLVEEETLDASGGQFGSSVRLMDNQSGRVRLLHEGRHSAGDQDPYVETTAPTSGTMLHRLYDLRHNQAANAFKEYLARWRYYDLDTSRLRDTQSRMPPTLMPDGSNLSLVLYQLKTVRERDYRRLMDAVKDLEPHLDALNFVPPASQDSVFMFMADERNNVFTLRALSNGTLRYLALAYVLMLETAEPRMVLIEEPENGLFVGHLKKLLLLMPPLDQMRAQVVFTSHSPYFIDLFDQRLDSVFVAKSADTHSEIAKPDPKRLEDVLKEFDLGEAHFRGLLQ